MSFFSSSIFDAVLPIISPLGAIAKPVFGMATDAVKEVWNTGKGLVTGLFGTVERVADNVSVIPGKIVDKGSELISHVADKGTELITDVAKTTGKTIEGTATGLGESVAWPLALAGAAVAGVYLLSNKK